MPYELVLFYKILSQLPDKALEKVYIKDYSILEHPYLVKTDSLVDLKSNVVFTERKPMYKTVISVNYSFEE